MKMPGKTDSHHSPETMYWAPSAIIAPSSGVGGWTPTPMKLIAAVSRIAQARKSVACAISTE